MDRVTVGLQPLVGRLNMPTVLKTAILPGDTAERLFVATQTGEIYYVGDENIEIFLDIRSRIIQLGAYGGYDERGLLGLAFHPEFTNNGLFYLHYSQAGTQGPGALSGPFRPDPCDPDTLNLRWEDRDILYDHIDTVEEWVIQQNGQPQLRRTLLNLRRPFLNHNGVNSLNFSPETGNLVLTTGDGGSGYDPFNLAQDDMEMAGKIIEIDVSMNTEINNPVVSTRFDELPDSVQQTLTVISKGVRNIPGISYQRLNNQYIKYVGNVGQNLVESIFAYSDYLPVPVTRLMQAADTESFRENFVNLGSRGWEGSLPTSLINNCTEYHLAKDATIAYFDETVSTAFLRIQPLTSYYHFESRPGGFAGTALTGVQPYMGNAISELTDSVVFTDLLRSEGLQSPGRGVLAYTRYRPDCKMNDYGIIETDYDFGPESALFVSLGTNADHTRIYLGTYASMNVTDYNRGTVYEIIP